MWSRIPLVRLIIPYIAGILLSVSVSFPISPGISVLWISAIIVFAGGIFYGVLFSYRSRWLFGSFIILFVFSCGYLFTGRMKTKGDEVLADIPRAERLYLARLDESFTMRERSCRGMLTLLSVRDSVAWRDVNAKAMVYTAPDSSLLQFTAGAYILIMAKIGEVKPPSNPGEFNYKEYLTRKGIFHSTYLKNGQWYVSGSSAEPELLQYASHLRRSLLEKLYENGITGGHFGISSALLLGEDSQLHADIRDVYARAGAMHILCVSGLHVGVIFIVLNSIFGFLKRSRPGRLLFPVLLMACIWFYALITGLAPPVIRASCMISFFILGNSMGRQKNVYNTLAASALLMLFLDPYLLFGAGFQLSYMAVLGIVSLQKPLNNLIYFKYSIPDRIWSITTVSIAAQLGTLPVVIYYFHQFPLYSLLTNLIVIPLSSFIIYAGFLLLFMPSLSIAASAAAWMLNTLISFMDAGVHLVDGIPYGLVEGIYIDIWMAAMTGMIICCIAVFFIAKRRQYLFAGLFLILTFSVYRLISSYDQQKQHLFVVYSVSGHSAYGIIEGREHIFMTDSLLLQSEGKLDYSIRPHWLERGLDEPEILLLPNTDKHPGGYGIWNMEKGTCKMVNGTCLRIMIWHGGFPRCHPPENKLRLDYLILRGRCSYELEDIFRWFDPGLVILDSSVPPWVEVPEGDGRFWAVREKRAFVSAE